MPIWQLTWKISHNSTYLPKRATSLMWSVHKAELRQHGINFTACPLSKKYHIKAFLGHFNQVLFKIFLIILTMHDSINLQHTQWCFAPSSQSTVLASCGGRGNFTNHTSLWLTKIIPSNGADSHHLRHQRKFESKRNTKHKGLTLPTAHRSSRLNSSSAMTYTAYRCTWHIHGHSCTHTHR